MRAPTSWVLACACLLLALVTVHKVRAASRGATLSQAVAAYTDSSTLDRRIQAAVLLQKADCTGNLRALDLLHRRDVRDRLRLAVIWFVGAAADSTPIRQLLPDWTQSVQLVAAPKDVLRELARLGHRETPTLIVLDQRGHIRLATQSPRSPREFAGLRRIVEGLTWIEEL